MKITKEVLEKYYISETKTAKEISTITGINKATVYWYLNLYNVS